MATTLEMIYSVRNLIKSWSDPSAYSDEFIYSILLKNAGVVIERRIRDNQPVSDQSFVPVCVKLVEDKFHTCGDCLPGCAILKTNVDIPKVFNIRGKITLRIFDFGMNEIPVYHIGQMGWIKKYRTLRRKPYATIFGNRILLYNSMLKAVVLLGLWQNYLELSDIKVCDDQGNDTGYCTEIQNGTFPLDESLCSMVIDMTLDMIRKGLVVNPQPEDKKVNEQTAI